MDGRAFDTLTRRAADVVSRRSSLAALGGATLAAGLLAPLTADAAKNKAKKAKKKAKKKCKQQQGECESAVQAFCTQEQKLFSICQGRLLQCCAFFASCDATAGSRCLLENNPFVPPDNAV